MAASRPLTSIRSSCTAMSTRSRGNSARIDVPHDGRHVERLIRRAVPVAAGVEHGEHGKRRTARRRRSHALRARHQDRPEHAVRRPSALIGDAAPAATASPRSFEYFDPAPEQPAVGAAVRVGRDEAALGRDPDGEQRLSLQRGHEQLARHTGLERDARAPRRRLEADAASARRLRAATAARPARGRVPQAAQRWRAGWTVRAPRIRHARRRPGRRGR